ncbi:transcriptional regulator, partial [Dokdonella sp.]|uniref:winged helix-turn-helix domain-containing protein n=1 Tax=Dokdonella sp. TaxID=2291710 RepID=UPI002608FA98
MSNIAFQIGSHRLDPARRELERDGALVALTPHVFDCLTYLVIHRERAIGRDELIAAVWGTVEVSDTLLSQTVMHARRAVGDNGADQRCIRTIPRYGFRWVGAVVPLVEETPDTGTPTPSEPAPSDTGEWHAKAPAAPPPRRFRRLLAAALAGVAIVVLLGVSLYARRETTTTQAASARDPDLVLVLPVRVADTRETAWIPLGVMDAIAGHLRTRRWSVVPSATAVAIANRMATGDSALPAPEWTHAGTVARPSARHDGRTWNVRIDLAGVGDLPPWVQAEAPELLDAARLAADRLLAVLRRQPLPELSRDDPDLAVSVVLQRVQAEFLAGRLDAAAAILASTPAAILAQPDIALKAAELDYRAGRLERAAEAFGGLLAQLPAESHPRQRAQALVGLGSIERTYTRLEAAEGYYREALSVLEPLGDPALTGLAQAYLGITLGSQRRHEEGLAALATARVLLERTGDELGLAMVEAGFATIEGDRRRPAAAAPRMERAIERLERFGSHADAVAMRIALAQMRGELLEHAAAEAVSAAVWAEIHDQPRQRLYQMAGAVHAQNLVALGRLDEARAVLGALDRDADAGDDSYQRRQTRLAAVLLEQAQGSREAGA